MNIQTAGSYLSDDTKIQSDNSNNHELFKKVATKAEQNKSFFSFLYNLGNQLKGIILTGYAGISNKLRTEYFLTTTRIFDGIIPSEKRDSYKMYLNPELCGEDINDFLVKKAAQKEPALAFQFIACKSNFVNHATILVQGITKEGKPFMVYFDPQAKDVYKTVLTYESDKTVSKHLDEYRKTQTLFKNVPIYKVDRQIQQDGVLCTGYCALFQKKLLSEFEKKDFDPESFVQKIENSEITVSYSEVQDMIAEAYPLTNPFQKITSYFN